MNREPIAEIAYTAYHAKLATVLPVAPPEWHRLSANEQEAWRAAVGEIVGAYDIFRSSEGHQEGFDKFMDSHRIKIGDWVTNGLTEKFQVTKIMEIDGHYTAWIKNENGSGDWHLSELTKVAAPEGARV